MWCDIQSRCYRLNMPRRYKLDGRCMYSESAAVCTRYCCALFCHELIVSYLLVIWSFVRGIHRSPVNSAHIGQWRGTLMFSLICVWINDWAKNPETLSRPLWRHRNGLQRPHSLHRRSLTGIGIHILNLWRSHHLLRFIMGISMSIRQCRLNAWMPWIGWIGTIAITGLPFLIRPAVNIAVNKINI